MRNPDAWRSLRSPCLPGLALSLAVVLLSLAALGEGTAAKPDLPTLPAVPTPAPAPTPSAPARGERLEITVALEAFVRIEKGETV